LAGPLPATVLPLLNTVPAALPQVKLYHLSAAGPGENLKKRFEKAGA